MDVGGMEAAHPKGTRARCGKESQLDLPSPLAALDGKAAVIDFATGRFRDARVMKNYCSFAKFTKFLALGNNFYTKAIEIPC